MLPFAVQASSDAFEVVLTLSARLQPVSSGTISAASPSPLALTLALTPLIGFDTKRKTRRAGVKNDQFDRLICSESPVHLIDAFR
jgi:hypothetical protein